MKLSVLEGRDGVILSFDADELLLNNKVSRATCTNQRSFLHNLPYLAPMEGRGLATTLVGAMGRCTYQTLRGTLARCHLAAWQMLHAEDPGIEMPRTRVWIQAKVEAQNKELELSSCILFRLSLAIPCTSCHWWSCWPYFNPLMPCLFCRKRSESWRTSKRLKKWNNGSDSSCVPRFPQMLQIDISLVVGCWCSVSWVDWTSHVDLNLLGVAKTNG